jgi:hypothetical protein
MKRTLSEYRAARAVELSLQGLNYDQIAAELGYSNRSGAWKAVRRCLARRQDAAAGAHIEISLLDLDLIQERAWKSAMSGDLTASRIALRAMEDRLRLVEFLSGPETQERKRAELAKAVNEDDAARAQARRERRKPETGYFHSLVV